MKTTVTLDDDVAAAVDLVRRQRGVGLSEAVNELVRRGMRSKSAHTTFPLPTADLGIGIDVRNVAEALGQLEGSG